MPGHALQVPLQPLQDNLELQTYETFERDSPKYTAYEEAMHDALLDRVPQSEAATRTTVLMVRLRPPNSKGHVRCHARRIVLVRECTHNGRLHVKALLRASWDLHQCDTRKQSELCDCRLWEQAEGRW